MFDATKNKLAHWRYYGRFFRGRRRSILANFLLSVAQSIILLPAFFMVRNLVDHVIPEGDTERLLWYGAALLGLLLGNGAINLLSKRIALTVNTAIIRDLRKDLIEKHYTLSPDYLTKTDRGKLHTIFLQDIGRIEDMGSFFISAILPSVFVSSVLVGILIYLNGFLFLLLLALFPVFALITQRIGFRIQKSVDAFRLSFQNLSKRMWFVLWMTELTRLQTAEPIELQLQADGLHDFRDRSVALGFLKSSYAVTQAWLVGSFGIVVLVAGGLAIASGSMSLGALASFYLASKLLQSFAKPLMASIPTIIAGNESLAEIYRLASVEERMPYHGSEQIAFSGNLELANVTFSYSDKPVLENASMQIQSGRSVALLGPNGAGKSTILKLALGYHRPQSGQVIADDRSYDELDMALLRNQIAVVPQNPSFFRGTIFENVVYGSPDATREQVAAAAEEAGASAFLARLPEGLDTPLADDGVLISGGERQLLAICRALLREPSLLILDEPTNHLSKQAVRIFLQSLKDGRGRRSTLIISHHWDIASEADVVYYLESGRLRQVERHELPQLSASVAG